MHRSWLLALALVACGGGSQSTPTKTAATDTPAPTHTCPETADHMLDMMSASAKAPPEQVKAVHDAIVAHCTDDKWSQEVMTCITKTAAPAEVEKCDDLLTPAQKDALAKDSSGGDAPPPPPNKLQSSPKGPPPPGGGGSRGPKKGGDPEDGGE